MRLAQRWLGAVIATGVLGGSAFLPADPAFAYTVPFQDENQNGTLTFCNMNRQAVTSGSLRDVPFVWNVASSTPAPAHYTRAYLDIFQPIQHEDAANWTGRQLTVQAVFSNPKHPMAQATYADEPLLWSDQLIPPYWDGLYELRMYFSQPLLAPYSTPYPAAVIRVTGDTWTLVSGGGSSCDSGTAVSVELRSLPKSETETPHVLTANGKNLTVPTASASVTPSTLGTTTGSTLSSGHSAQSTPPTTKRPAGLATGVGAKGGSDGSATWVIGAIAAVVVGGGAGGWWLWRRRRASPSRSAI